MAYGERLHQYLEKKKVKSEAQKKIVYFFVSIHVLLIKCMFKQINNYFGLSANCAIALNIKAQFGSLSSARLFCDLFSFG